MKTNFFKITMLALLLAAGTQITYTMQNRPYNVTQEYHFLINDLRQILHKHNYPRLSTDTLQTNLYFTILDNYCRTHGKYFAYQMYPEYHPKVNQCDNKKLIFRNTFLQSCLDYFALTGIYLPSNSPLYANSVSTQRATPTSNSEPSLPTLLEDNKMTDLQFADSCLNFDNN